MAHPGATYGREFVASWRDDATPWVKDLMCRMYAQAIPITRHFSPPH